MFCVTNIESNYYSINNYAHIIFYTNNMMTGYHFNTEYSIPFNEREMGLSAGSTFAVLRWR